MNWSRSACSPQEATLQSYPLVVPARSAGAFHDSERLTEGSPVTAAGYPAAPKDQIPASDPVFVLTPPTAHTDVPPGAGASWPMTLPAASAVRLQRPRADRCDTQVWPLLSYRSSQRPPRPSVARKPSVVPGQGTLV